MDNLPPVQESPRTSAVSLPLAVGEHIIRSLDREEDRVTIAVCARVCSSWLPSSRHKLYHEVAIRSERQWELFEQLLLSEEPSFAGGVQPYLENTHTLIIGPATLDHEEFDNEPWAHFVFLGCEPFMPALKRMVISCLRWQHPYFDEDSQLHYPSVTALETKSCSFDTIHDVHDLVFGFSALTELTLGVHSMDAWMSFSELQSENPRLPLERLEIQSQPDCMRPIIVWLKWARWPLHRLTDLVWRPSDHEYQFPTDQYKKITDALLREILPAIEGPSLKTTRLTLCHGPRMDAPCFSNLTILDLLYEEIDWAGLPQHLQLIAFELARYTRCLEETRFEYRLPDFPASPLDLTEFRSISETLSGPLLSDLRKFTLVLKFSGVRSMAVTFLPIEISSASVPDLLAQYDTAPMTSDEFSAAQHLFNPGFETARWMDVLATEMATILQRRVLEQFKLMPLRTAVDIQVAMRFFLHNKHMLRAKGYDV